MSLLPINGMQLTDSQNQILGTLWNDGFVKVSGLWDSESVKKFVTVCTQMMAEQPVQPWHTRSSYGDEFRLPVFEDRNWAVLSNLSGLSHEFDAFLEKLLRDEYLRPILDAVLGTDYKIWETSIRRSQIADGGLALHQDSVGEFGLSILLTDIPDLRGTTAFVKGSHLYPVPCKSSGLDQFNPSTLRPFLSPAAGKAGDVVLFFKNVWHGRIACNIPTPQDAILMSFIAAGYDYQSFEVPQALLQTLPPETSSMLNPYVNTKPLSNGRRLVESSRPQGGRLIDAVYQSKPTDMHPAQLLRIFSPAGALKRGARRVAKRFRAPT